MGFPDSKWQPRGEHVMSSWAVESRAVHWPVFCKWVQVIKVSARDIFFLWGILFGLGPAPFLPWLAAELAEDVSVVLVQVDAGPRSPVTLHFQSRTLSSV